MGPPSPPSVWPRSLFSEDLPRPSPCPPENTPEDPRTFQVVTTDPPEPSQEDTRSRPKSKTLKPVTAPLTSKSRTDELPCLVSPAACTPAWTRATTTSSTPSPTTKKFLKCAF